MEKAVLLAINEHIWQMGLITKEEKEKIDEKIIAEK